MYVYFTVHALVGLWWCINLRPEHGAPINQIKNSITTPDEFFTAEQREFFMTASEKCAELICHFSSTHLMSSILFGCVVLLSLLQFNPLEQQHYFQKYT
jgi:hypothetical protein